jgi:hypothetical protein
MGIALVIGVYVLFAVLVLRPWLTRRLHGQAMPKASARVAFALIAVTALAASAIGNATGSEVAALAVGLAALTGFSTACVLWLASRPPKSN